MNQIEFLIGQIGRKREKVLSLGMLLTTDELPGANWRMIGEVCWRSGIGGQFGSVSKRARQSGAFAAIRRFRQEEPPRGLFVQVGPYASEEDAKSQVQRARSAGGMAWPGVERLEERDINDVDVPGVSDSQVGEHLNVRGRVRGFQRFIAGRVEHVVFLVSGSAIDLGWSWNDLVPIAGAQAEKIQGQL